MCEHNWMLKGPNRRKNKKSKKGKRKCPQRELNPLAFNDTQMILPLGYTDPDKRICAKMVFKPHARVLVTIVVTIKVPRGCVDELKYHVWPMSIRKYISPTLGYPFLPA